MRGTAARASEPIEFIKKGLVTIPKRLRDKYRIVPGDKGTIIELDGGFLVLPAESKIPALLDEIREGLATSDVSLKEMAAEIRSARD